jgi:hypothetical protein
MFTHVTHKREDDIAEEKLKQSAEEEAKLKEQMKVSA